MLLIDHIGRQRSLISGIVVQQISMLYIAITLTVETSLDNDQSPSAKRASLGAIVFIYFVGIGWAMGWNSIQYLLNAEIFPLQVRATGSSLLMCFHYANRYGLSKVCVANLLLTSPILTLIGCSIHAIRGLFKARRNILVLLCSYIFWFVMDVVFTPGDSRPYIRGDKWPF